MPVKYSKEVRAFALGLMLGVGGAPYDPPAVRSTIIERFGDEITTKTLSNWKSDLEGQREKYNIPMEYIQEVLGRAFKDATGAKLKREESGKPNGKNPGRKTGPNGPGEDDSGNGSDDSGNGKERPEEVVPVPVFTTLGEMVGYMEQRGFIVATSDQDLRKILESNGYTLLEKGALRYGRDIISLEPIVLDFEAVGKQIGGNAVIMWYYGLARKLAELAKEEPPELVDYVTSCVVDAMVARKYNMALLIA